MMPMNTVLAMDPIDYRFRYRTELIAVHIHAYAGTSGEIMEDVRRIGAMPSDYWIEDALRPTVGSLMQCHRKAIEYCTEDESGLVDAVRDPATLEYIADKAGRIEGGKAMTAAWVMWSVANYHPFVEGNKRTALIASQMALGDSLIACHGKEDSENLNRFVREVAAGNRTEGNICDFIRSNSIRVEITADKDLMYYIDRTQKDALILLGGASEPGTIEPTDRQGGGQA